MTCFPTWCWQHLFWAKPPNNCADWISKQTSQKCFASVSLNAFLAHFLFIDFRLLRNDMKNTSTHFRNPKIALIWTRICLARKSLIYKSLIISRLKSALETERNKIWMLSWTKQSAQIFGENIIARKAGRLSSHRGEHVMQIGINRKPRFGSVIYYAFMSHNNSTKSKYHCST